MPAPDELIHPDADRGQPPWSSEDALAILAEAGRRRLTGGELLLLCEEAALPDLGRAAHALRLARGDPASVTYVVGAVLPRDGGGDPSPEAAVAEARPVYEAGGRALLLRTDDPGERGLGICTARLSALRSAFPDLRLHGFPPVAVRRLAAASGLQTLETLRRLREAGLDVLDGAGAGLIGERLRRRLAPDLPAAREWIEISEEAHYLGLSSTAAMLCGCAEAHPERVEHLLRLRDSQDRTSGYAVYVSRLAPPAGAPPALAALREGPAARGGGPDVLDDLRSLAIARLALDNFAHLRADWRSHGGLMGRLVLYFGASDLGRAAPERPARRPGGAPEAPARGDLETMIRDAGFVPDPRDCGISILPPPSRDDIAR